MLAQQEKAEVTYPHTIGEATINLISPPYLNAQVDILQESGTEPYLATLAKPIKFQDLRGNYQTERVSTHVLGVFDSIIRNNAKLINQDIEEARPFGLKVAVVTPESFRTIRINNPPPQWVRVFVSGDGTVVYNARYIQSVLAEDGEFGGEQFGMQYFYEESANELLHSLEDAMFFHNDRAISGYFYTTNRWYIEGLKEAMVRHHTGLSDEEFIMSLREMGTIHPQFSIEELNKSLFIYDKSVTNRNIAYQYCGRFLRHLISKMKDKLLEKDPSLDLDNHPYQGAYYLMNEAVKRYENGHRESIIDVLEAEKIVTREELLKIEKEWVESLLASQGDPF